MKSILLTIFLLIMALPTGKVMAQRSMPHLEGAGNPGAVIDSLVVEMGKDRVYYNHYNDSMFMVPDKEEWVNFIQRRARVNQLIYDSNRKMLQEMDRYFMTDSIVKPFGAYDTLRLMMHGSTNSSKLDPFFRLHYDKILEKFIAEKQIPDSVNNLPMLFTNIAGFAYNIYRASGDTIWARTSYEYMKRCLDEKYKECSNFEQQRLWALATFATTNFVQAGVQSQEEYKQMLRRFDELMKGYTPEGLKKLCKTPSSLNYIKTYYSRMADLMIFNLYLPNLITLPKETADSLMRTLVEKYHAKTKHASNDRLRIFLVMEKLGDMSYDDALRMAMEGYETLWKKTYGEGRLTAEQLADYMKPFNSLFYIIEYSSLPDAEKRALVLRLCKDIEDVYLRRKDQQYDSRYIKYLNTISTYERVTKYLSPEERIHFLMTLNVSTQVTTYAHSLHVGELSKILVNGIAKYEPQLLVGLFGCKNARQVKRQKQRFIDYVENAALYHDLGKISISSVVNNDFRPLYKEELDIIRQHPELGLKFLALSPQLDQYRDVMLGHHKWYNGEGGYPAWFDNTKSPYRTIIDIVTLCDCLQSATERVGRNYKATKSFETALGELRRDAGTRYNPELFRFLDAHPDVAEQLTESITQGWRNIYYDIYSQFFHNKKDN